jgi:hypothetical protein
VTIAEKGGKTAAFQAAFMRHELEDWADAKGALSFPAERVHSFSPKSLSVLEIRSERDLEVLTRIYKNSVLLGDDSPNGWSIKYGTEFHMTADSKLFIPREKADEAGYKPDDYGRWISSDDDVLLPLYEGRMIGQFDFSKKGWVSGKGRTAVWRDIPWEKKVIEPQFTIRRGSYVEHTPQTANVSRVAFMDITAATNARTMIATALPPLPCGNSAPILLSAYSPISLSMVLNSYAYDFAARARCGGLHLNYFVVEETPLVSPLSMTPALPWGVAFSSAPALAQLVLEAAPALRLRPAITSHERLRVRCILDAFVAALYGLSREDLRWILRDCDHPKDRLSEQAFCRKLDPKGFWRIDKDQDPELRHTVLTLVAFDELERQIAAHDGDRDAGIKAFAALNDEEGWMLPETLCLIDHDLGHDVRARTLQPVASRLGPRFLDWQLAQTPEESWAECEGHARVLLGDEEFDRRFAPSAEPTQPALSVEPAPVRPAERVTGTSKAHVTATAPAASETPQLSLLVPTPTVSATPADTPTPALPEPLPMTISQIRLLNFRNWADEHWGDTGITLRPITLLLGRNSAGKTSILQPLRMLKQSIEATDAGTHLLMDSGGDGINLGEYEDVVHGHDGGRELGVGIDLADPKLSVDIRFRMVDDRPTIDTLSYRLGDEKVDVTRTPNAYQLSSPRFRLPNWDGAQHVHEPRQNYRPGRAIEFSEDALADLGPTLGPRVRDAMVAVKDAFKKFHYLGPLRPPPAREVAWSQQDPTRLGSMGQETIQALISNETGRDKGALKASVSAWLKRLDLADGIDVKRIGRSRLFKIEVIRGSNRSNLVDVGFGISQVLPVIVLLHFAPEGSVILCEDPEAHLHPMAQAELADMFVEVTRQRKLQLLLETHSEHLFRRLQFLIADGKMGSDDCALYYVDRDQPSSKLTTLQTDEFGRVHNWPDNFFGDAIGEVEKQTHKVFERMRKARSRG